MTTKPLPDLDPKHGYLMSMTLENVRCFGSPAEELSLASPKDQSKPARWTVILGANGVGKTTVLRALALSSNNPMTIEDYYRTIKLQRANGFEARISLAESREVKLNISFGVETDDGGKPNIRRRVFANQEQPMPLKLAAYGAGRAWRSAREKASTSIDTLFDRDAQTRDPSQTLANWTSFELSNYRIDLTLVENLKAALISLLPDVSAVELDHDKEKRPFAKFQTPDGWIALDDMSWGYQVFAAFAADYASRLIEWYPESKTPLSEPGICLVDELDLHMHPKWQREVIDHLSNVFPATQFIVTVHSPLVVQAAEEANLVVLKRYPDDQSRVKIESNIEPLDGWRIDQVLTSELFGLESSRPPSVEKALEERRTLLAQDNLTLDDAKRLKSLDAMAMELSSPESKWEKEAQALVLEAAASLKARA